MRQSMKEAPSQHKMGQTMQMSPSKNAAPPRYSEPMRPTTAPAHLIAREAAHALNEAPGAIQPKV